MMIPDNLAEILAALIRSSLGTPEPSDQPKMAAYLEQVTAPDTNTPAPGHQVGIALIGESVWG